MILPHFKRPIALRCLSGAIAVSSLCLLSCDQKPTSQQDVLKSDGPPANILPPSSSPASEQLEFLRLQAEAGFVDKQYKLAYYLTIHQQQPSDLVLAKDWYTKAAEKGHIEASYRLGIIHAEGVIDGNSDLHQATKWFLKAATEGHSGAQFELGRYCLQGEGVTKSPEKALAWLQLAAHQYHPGAQYLLGRMHETGNGVSPNLDLAYKWYKLAADSGYPAALYKSAEMAEKGIGTSVDTTLAKSLYAKAHAQGLPNRISEPSTTVNGNSVTERESVFAASSKANSPAKYTNAGPAGPEGTPLHSRIEQGKNENLSTRPTTQTQNDNLDSKPRVEPSSNNKVFIEPTAASVDFKKELLEKQLIAEERTPQVEEKHSTNERLEDGSSAANNPSNLSGDKGKPDALYRVAMEFLNPPESQTPDLSSAITFFEKAAAKGHSPSQYELAELYYKGINGSPNYSQAFIWYRLAANNQIAKAQFRLGSMFYKGEGVEQDTDKAKSWLHLAASQNSQEAISFLQTIHQKEQAPKVTEPVRTVTETIPRSAEQHNSIPRRAENKVVPRLTPKDWFQKGLKLYTSDVQPSQETYLEAYKCFVQAANANYGDAWYYIGKMYDYGEGLKSNPVKAFECYLVAAREGNPNAQYSLGFMYETGLGCRKNTSEAYVWYALAAENGLPNANQTKIGLENKMSVGEIGYAKRRMEALQEYLQNYKNQPKSK